MENPDRFHTDHLRGGQDGVVQGSDIGVLVKDIVAAGNSYASCPFESERKGFVEEFGLDLNTFSFFGYFDRRWNYLIRDKQKENLRFRCSSRLPDVEPKLSSSALEE